MKDKNTREYPAEICGFHDNLVEVVFDDGKKKGTVKRSDVRLMPNEEHPEKIVHHLRLNELIKARYSSTGEWFRAKVSDILRASLSWISCSHTSLALSLTPHEHIPHREGVRSPHSWSEPFKRCSRGHRTASVCGSFTSRAARATGCG